MNEKKNMHDIQEAVWLCTIITERSPVRKLDNRGCDHQFCNVNQNMTLIQEITYKYDPKIPSFFFSFLTIKKSNN